MKSALYSLQNLSLVVAIMLFVAVFIPSAHAGNIDRGFKPPTTRVNGEPLSLSEIASYQLYRDGVAINAPIPVGALSVSLPACEKHQWQLATTDTSGLTGPLSDALTLVPDKGCAPGKVVWAIL